MATKETIGILMSEVGPVLDPLAIEAYSDDPCWAVALDEDTLVLVYLDQRKDSLVLSCSLGEPPPGDRTTLYEKLLQLNFHWDVTGGSRMAIDGPGGHVVQMFEIPAEGLDVLRLVGLLRTFAQVATAWREIVQRPAALQSNTLELHPPMGLRV